MLNAHDQALLVALRVGEHFKANPGNVQELLSEKFGDVGPSERQSSARRLHAHGLAAFVTRDSVPNQNWLRITDSGIAYADSLIEQNRKKTLAEHVGSITRSDWIALGAFGVSVIALFRGG